MNADRKPSILRKAGRLALWVFTPIPAVRKTYALTKNELERTKGNLVLLKGMGEEARQAVLNSKKDRSAHNDSFEAVMNEVESDTFTRSDLYRAFLRKKRIALGMAAFFVLFGVYGIASGLLHDDVKGAVLGILSLVASQPVCFLIALGAQLRLWQLRTGRLSREERGSLRDYTRDEKNWWLKTLDPEIGHERGKP